MEVLKTRPLGRIGRYLLLTEAMRRKISLFTSILIVNIKMSDPQIKESPVGEQFCVPLSNPRLPNDLAWTKEASGRKLQRVWSGVVTLRGRHR